MKTLSIAFEDKLIIFQEMYNNSKSIKYLSQKYNVDKNFLYRINREFLLIIKEELKKRSRIDIISEFELNDTAIKILNYKYNLFDHSNNKKERLFLNREVCMHG